MDKVARYAKGLTLRGTFVEQLDPHWTAGAKTSAWILVLSVPALIFIAGLEIGMRSR